VVTRVIVALTLPLAVRRVHAHLGRPAFENEPVVIEILCNVLPAEYVSQKRPGCLSIVGVDQRVNRGNHIVIWYTDTLPIVFGLSPAKVTLSGEKERILKSVTS